MSVLEHTPITANESERPVLNQIEEALKNGHRLPRLIGPYGEEIELPQSVFQVLRHIVYHMMRGTAIFIVPENKELTTQEAADLLNVSRPHLIKLLEQEKIPFVYVGTHRRIRFSDLMQYKARRDTEREQALNEMAQMSQELGLYD